jgi:hypothetical protein|tara:strand:+ start:203 stop:673 length:471 start_codon:yes stop_codon:yes gene_type:complete
MSSVNTKTMQKIADLLATGESLVSICKRKGIPSYSSITRAVQADDELWDIYRRGRVLQAEYFGDSINELARSPLPDTLDPRVVNAEVQRRRLEIDSLKWTLARMQPYGLRDKKSDGNANAGAITLSWSNGEVEVKAETGSDEATKPDGQVVALRPV